MRRNFLISTALMAGLLFGASAGAETLNLRINADIRGTEGIDRDGNTDTVLHHIFETLVGFRADLSVGPALAESWTVSEDGKTYTFTIREGATFHNGDPVTSADVKWNWDHRVAAGEDWFCNAFFDGSQGLKVEALETPDPRTVLFRINEPNALFLAQLANIQCNGWIASPKNAGPDGKWIADSAIGSGSFKLKEWAKGQYITLERYDGYKSSGEKASGYAGDRTALVDEAKFLIIPDVSAAETALFAGELDVLSNFEPQRIKDAEARDLQVLTTPGLSMTPILIQTADPLMSNVTMRRAIAHAIDFKQIAAARTAILVNSTPRPCRMPAPSSTRIS